MLLRMYTRWAEKHEFSVSVIEHSPGEVAWNKVSIFADQRKLRIRLAENGNRRS
jgi:protein subunit release factor B